MHASLLGTVHVSPIKQPPQLGARTIGYSNSNVALGLPSSGLKSTTSESLTAKTESFSRYWSFESKICVVTGL